MGSTFPDAAMIAMRPLRPHTATLGKLVKRHKGVYELNAAKRNARKINCASIC